MQEGFDLMSGFGGGGRLVYSASD